MEEIYRRLASGKPSGDDAVVIRSMREEDVEDVRSLWMTIEGFAIRSIDDSAEDVCRFIRRNPETSAVAVEDSRIVGAILCWNDGRQGCFYHVCVAADRRRRGIGTRLAVFCMEALRREKINKVTLIAFQRNDAGNAFWRQIGWTGRQDVNYYEFVLNRQNITSFIQADEALRQQRDSAQRGIQHDDD